MGSSVDKYDTKQQGGFIFGDQAGSRLTGCQIILLTLVGRTTPVQSVLTSISTYYLTVLKVPNPSSVLWAVLGGGSSGLTQKR